MSEKKPKSKIITAAQLRKGGACEAGLASFVSVFGKKALVNMRGVETLSRHGTGPFNMYFLTVVLSDKQRLRIADGGNAISEHFKQEAETMRANFREQLAALRTKPAGNARDTDIFNLGWLWCTREREHSQERDRQLNLYYAEKFIEARATKKRK